MGKHAHAGHAHAHATHDHHHGHTHDHGHAHAPADFGRAFTIGMAVQIVFIVVEVAFGLGARSLALLADAGHNVADVASLGLAWGAATLAKRKPSKQRTYGMRRVSILAGLFNGVSLMFVTGGVAWESVRRLLSGGTEVGSVDVIVIAGIGVLVNGGAALAFMSGRKRDLNVRAAFLHLASDALISLGVSMAGVIMLLTRWTWLDPVVSLLLSAAVLVSTWSLLRDAFNLALDAVPAGIDMDDVRAFLGGLPEVVEVHDLHVWAVSTTETLLTAHVVVTGPTDDAFLGDVCEELHRRFGIGHATVQVEHSKDAGCRLAPEGTM